MALSNPLPAQPLLSLRGIRKSFPGIQANDRVDLDVFRGEVHALLGENGAGKSTLMKVLYGYYHADAGEITLNGGPVQIHSPRDARAHRIGMLFQNFTLIPALTVVENVALFLPDLPALLNRRQIADRLKELSERYDLRVDPWAPVWQLSVGEQQKVEVLKLLLANSQILILDEPTKVLVPHEVEGLFRVFTNLRRDGYAVIFITHKLQEVLTCADRITVMRKGQVVGAMTRKEATESGLVSLMFGTVPSEPRVRQSEKEGRDGVPRLELRGAGTRTDGTRVALQDINLVIHPGELVGVAGVSGNGQKELGDAVLGLEPLARGSVWLDGADASHWSVAKFRAHGVAFIPEDPLAMAAVPGMTIAQNIALGDTTKYSQMGGFSVDWQAVREDAQNSSKRLGLPLASLDAYAGALSGGNLQRVIVVRELAGNPRLIVAFYPTRGLDVKGAIATREQLLAARDAGAGVLLISEDLGELFALSDRLVVLSGGRIAGTFKPAETTMYEIGYLMTGSRGENVKHES